MLSPGAFVPFTPRKVQSSAQRRRRPLRRNAVPRANCPQIPLVQTVSREKPPTGRFEDWLEEHKRWKNMQRIGFLESHFPMREIKTREEQMQTVSLVELSFDTPQAAGPARKNSLLGPPQFPQTCRSRRRDSKSSFPAGALTARGRLVKRSEEESIYEDPQTHRLFACVKMPSARSSSKPSVSTKLPPTDPATRPKTGGSAVRARLPLSQILSGFRDRKPVSPAKLRPPDSKDAGSTWSGENTPMLESRYTRKSGEGL